MLRPTPESDCPQMPRKRKKKLVRVIHQSVGPLPERLAGQYAERLLVFSDASLKRQGGLAAVLFADPEATPVVGTRTVPLVGSNELELQAALFGLQQAERHFPGKPLALFSDNQDAVLRLNRAKEQGLAQDPALTRLLAELEVGAWPEQLDICWVKGHATCRGNTLADQHAADAAR